MFEHILKESRFLNIHIWVLLITQFPKFYKKRTAFAKIVHLSNSMFKGFPYTVTFPLISNWSVLDISTLPVEEQCSTV